MEGKPNLIADKTFSFSLKIIELADRLEKLRKYGIAGQLLRAGTSIGANVHEAQNAESLRDFIHKMKIAVKEAEKTKYWLRLIAASESLPNPGIMTSEISDIVGILNRIIATSKNKLQVL